MHISGVAPGLAQVADLGPPRSEIGIGALMPWAGKLYVQNYLSHKRSSGSGTSLRRIDADFSMEVVPETLGVDGTYTNRFVHFESNQLVIGPHVIDAEHQIRTVAELAPLRVCGTSRHLRDPDRLVYVLCMEGELFELDVRTLECRQVADLNVELGSAGEFRVHYRDCYTAYGRLAEFDGTIFAAGWDRASALLSVYTDIDGRWTRYRLPKASHTFDHKWQTEWPRIREVEHERFLLDHHGMFYELKCVHVEPGQTVTHVFPTGFSAHWVRLVSDTDTVASAQFFYT